MKEFKSFIFENKQKIQFFNFVYSDLESKFGKYDSSKISTYNKILSYLKKNLPKWGNNVSEIAISFISYKNNEETKDESISNLIKRLDKLQSVNEDNDETKRFDINLAVEYFNEKMNELFDSSFYKFIAHVDDTLGKSINFAFSQKGWEYSPKETPTYMMFMLPFNEDISSQVYKIQKITMDEKLIEGGVIFTEISGYTPMDATKQLVNWFEENKYQIGEIARK